MGHLDGHAGEDKLVDILEEDNHLEEDNRRVDIRLEGDIQLVGRLVGDSLLGVDIHVLGMIQADDDSVLQHSLQDGKTDLSRHACLFRHSFCFNFNFNLKVKICKKHTVYLKDFLRVK